MLLWGGNTLNLLQGFWEQSGFQILTQGDNWKYIVMLGAACLLIYLAIVKKYEPLLLMPIAAGMLLANLPGAGLDIPEAGGMIGGLLYYLSIGNKLVIYPPLIFLGIGAMTDFTPLIANPKIGLIGIAAQVGIFASFFFALAMGFSSQEAAAIGIIGSSDGPTTIYLSNMLAPHMQGTITVAAYSYMALIPIIQPPLMRLFTSKKERAIKMDQLPQVSKRKKIIFPIAVTILVSLLVPQSATLIGMLMIGNLFKESGVVEKLVKGASVYMMYIIIILIGFSVGSTTKADTFLSVETLIILVLGLAAFAISTVSGILFAKVMCKLDGGRTNPLIGSAGVSAMPMAARVVQKVVQEENPGNFLLMHAMGPTVASTIGSAVIAGIFITLFS
jgi:oxaloacetate decarboxylase beta subunit